MKHIEVREPESPIGLKDIEQAENEMGIKFPKDYKQFLLKVNGGHPIKDTFPVLQAIGNDPRQDSAEIAWLSAIYNGENYNLVKEYNLFKGDRTPEDLLTIADDSLGNKICLCIKGKNLDKVYFWDFRGQNPDENEAWYDNVYLVAESFTDFINSLYRVDVELLLDDIAKWTITHDKCSLGYSNEIKKHGSKFKDFFDQAPSVVDEFLVEETDESDSLYFKYDDPEKQKRYVRQMKKSGEIVKDYTEDLPSL